MEMDDITKARIDSVRERTQPVMRRARDMMSEMAEARGPGGALDQLRRMVLQVGIAEDVDMSCAMAVLGLVVGDACGDCKLDVEALLQVVLEAEAFNPLERYAIEIASLGQMTDDDPAKAKFALWGRLTRVAIAEMYFAMRDADARRGTPFLMSDPARMQAAGEAAKLFVMVMGPAIQNHLRPA